MGGCYSRAHGEPVGNVVEEEYHTIRVKIGDDEYKHVYLGTNNQRQQLFYGPPLGEPVNEPRHNYSSLFQLTKIGVGSKISNYVTREAGQFARLTQSRVKDEGDIVLDEEGDTEFIIQYFDKDTTIGTSSKVMWYATEYCDDPDKRRIKAKVFGEGADEPSQFLVTKALTTFEVMPPE